MTKIPSVEEVVERFKKVSNQTASGFLVSIDSQLFKQALIEQRTALLTELRNSGLLEEIRNGTKVDWEEYPISEDGADSYNHLARAIKAHINNLINPVGV